MFTAACATHVVPVDEQPQVTAIPKLENKTQNEVQRTMGEPVVIRAEEAVQLWAYRHADCSTLVYFDATGVSRFAEARGHCAKTLAKLN